MPPLTIIPMQTTRLTTTPTDDNPTEDTLTHILAALAIGIVLGATAFGTALYLLT